MPGVLYDLAPQRRHVKRRLLNFMTALSVLLCVAVAVLWVRGYWASDLFGYVAVRGDGSRLAGWVCSGRGGLGITFSHLPPGLIQARGPSWRKQAPVYGGTDWPEFARGGFGFYAAARTKPATGVRHVGAVVPSPVALAAAAAPLALSVRRRRRRRAAGLCPRCGYDLRPRPNAALSAGMSLQERWREALPAQWPPNAARRST